MYQYIFAKIVKLLNFVEFSMRNILYVHGMGGGSDSRIPSILQNEFSGTDINVVVRTYDFDPEIGAEQVEKWTEELCPSLVIGESLGSLHALRIKGVPHITISPALNAPKYFGLLSFLVMLPGVTGIFDRIYVPREGDRQPLHFTRNVLRKYPPLRRMTLGNSVRTGSGDYFHAFIGTRDHYRRSGIVSLSTWKRYFGETYTMYDGTHFMEEEFVRTLLVDKVLEVLDINK